VNLDEIASDTHLQAFISAADQLPAPRILGLISDDYKPMEAVKGLRLMGQRFLPDGYIFQELIHPESAWQVPAIWFGCDGCDGFRASCVLVGAGPFHSKFSLQ
jgi:hypothetical protein